MTTFQQTIDRLARLADQRGGIARLSAISGIGHSTLFAIASGRSRNPTVRVMAAIEQGLAEIEESDRQETAGAQATEDLNHG